MLIVDNPDGGVSTVDPDPAELPTEWLIDLAGTDPAIDAELLARQRLSSYSHQRRR